MSKIIKCKLIVAGEPTVNGRIYSEESLKKMCSDFKCPAFGYSEFDRGVSIDSNPTHIVQSVWYDENSKTIMANIVLKNEHEEAYENKDISLFPILQTPDDGDTMNTTLFTLANVNISVD